MILYLKLLELTLVAATQMKNRLSVARTIARCGYSNENRPSVT
ncbi:hypothetical protein [Carnobacterium sp. ISL-102]|nr:hypothetical protein [Carnobacterium sp. ISL-102]